MQSKKVKVDLQVNTKGEEKVNRIIWCSRGEHWNKSNWKRIDKPWTRIKDDSLKEHLLNQLWEEVMDLGRRKEPASLGYAHRLENWEIVSIIGTMTFFQLNEYHIEQTKFDLFYARYRVFDWIATNLHGRMEGYPEEDEGERIRATWVMCKFAEIYLNLEGDVKAFSEYLRLWDLEPEYEERE